MFSIDKDTCPVCCFLNRLLEATKKYTLLDFAMFKTCLFSFGLLAGVSLSRTKDGFKSAVLKLTAIAFIASYIYIFIRTFFHLSEEK